MLDRPRPNSSHEGPRTFHQSDVSRLRRAAWAFTTRRVRTGSCRVVLDATAPKAGDLLLARVDAIGYHSGLQLPEGRRKHLFVGDEIVVAYGNRYAPNQFEAVVPKTLAPCHLVAAGGIASKALSWHASVTKPATQITPLGLLTDGTGKPVNVRDHAMPAVDQLPDPCPPTIAIVGTAMDAGKTQTAAHLSKGLSLAGLRVGYAKVTGTGSGGDTWLLKDAAAHPVLDFTDAGLASTYMEPPDVIRSVFITLIAHLTRSGVDAIVLEIADGVLQEETATLLESEVFRDVVTGVIFAAGDAMGALAGDAWLRQRNLPVLGVGGVLTSAPLQRRECSKVSGLPVLSRQDLAQPRTAMRVLRRAERPGRETEHAKSWPGALLAAEPNEVPAALPVPAAKNGAHVAVEVRS